MSDPNVTQQDVDDCNDDRSSIGESSVTADDIQEVREQTPEE